MKFKAKETVKAYPDGFTLLALEKGQEYDVSDSFYEFLKARGLVEIKPVSPVKETKEVKPVAKKATKKKVTVKKSAKQSNN